MLLHRLAPHHKAFAFGLRIVGSAQDRACVKHRSGLDRALIGTSMPKGQMFTLREAFSENDLPSRVEIVNMVDLPEGWNTRAKPQ